ncbi:UPF0729 protein C18orf32 homolog isoform X1 [Cervus canadensis]|uniref:UPF0729 protein C18orf32 homolog isoform X1 n=1 Tax=Cervus canadensis TaxID=1574408 RepID=UPI001CA3267A|nr:UPF0729 protein C18orf32 homolog isoform X1 [Cervus canadensis]
MRSSATAAFENILAVTVKQASIQVVSRSQRRHPPGPASWVSLGDGAPGKASSSTSPTGSNEGCSRAGSRPRPQRATRYVQRVVRLTQARLCRPLLRYHWLGSARPRDPPSGSVDTVPET